jgi:hypothetical protein
VVGAPSAFLRIFAMTLRSATAVPLRRSQNARIPDRAEIPAIVNNTHRACWKYTWLRRRAHGAQRRIHDALTYGRMTPP